MLLKLRRDFPVFRRTRFLNGLPIGNIGLKDVAWLAPEGHEFTDKDWSVPYARCLGMEVYRDGLQLADGGDSQHFLMLLNAHDGPISFKLPEAPLSATWVQVFDTGRMTGEAASFRSGETYPLLHRSFVVLRDT